MPLSFLSRVVALYLATHIIFVPVFAQRQRNTKIKEQTSFGSDFDEKGPMEHPLKLPKDVSQQLLEFEEGQLKRCLDDEPPVDKHFAASKINLNGDAAPDIIVQATSLCFMGAHNTTWWVFSNVNAQFGLRVLPGYDLLFSGRGDFFAVLNTKTNGFRDLSIANFAAAGAQVHEAVYKFDGQIYQPKICTITNNGKKPIRVRCGQ